MNPSMELQHWKKTGSVRTLLYFSFTIPPLPLPWPLFRSGYIITPLSCILFVHSFGQGYSIYPTGVGRGFPYVIPILHTKRSRLTALF